MGISVGQSYCCINGAFPATPISGLRSRGAFSPSVSHGSPVSAVGLLSAPSFFVCLIGAPSVRQQSSIAGHRLRLGKRLPAAERKEREGRLIQ